MLKADALSQLKQLKHDIKASRNLQIGTVKGTANKFGFVTLESGKDVFLPADEMAKVLPGDRVEVEIKKEPKNKVFALIEKLIESPTKYFFGKYVTRGSAHFIEPDIAGMSQWFFVPPAKRKDAKNKDYVSCKLTQHPFKSGKAQAAVTSVIGSESDQGIEWDYAIAKHALENSWSQEVEAELANIDESAITGAQGREDLTHVPFVTIDSASTQDMDDALWVEAQEQGWKLRVAIADPAALIPVGGAIEKALLTRATSAYFPGRAIPMLPSKLSSDLGSLVEGKDRLAKVVSIAVSETGQLGEVEIVNARVRSAEKLSYQDASERMANEASELAADQMLVELSKLADQLENWRQENALVHPGRSEFYLELNDKMKVESISAKSQTLAHKVVEACMVAVNRVVAEKLATADVDSIFVTHKGVREDRLDSLTTVLGKQLETEVTLDALPGYVETVQKLLGDEAKQSLFSLLSRQQEKTRLLSRAEPHFGMGLASYTTFTSPLRKASDFLLHRQVDAFLQTGKWVGIDAAHVEQIEQGAQSARSALFDVEQWLKCQFMKKSDKNLEAKVVRVFAAGCQVRLEQNGIEGFLSARELEGKYSFDQDMMTLKGQDFQFELDQVLTVDFKMVDWKRKQIQFVPSVSGASAESDS